MKRVSKPTTDGLEWLRAVRRELQDEIGRGPQERAAYYQAKDKKLQERILGAARGARRAS